MITGEPWVYSSNGFSKVVGHGREVQGLRQNGELFPMEISIQEVKIENERIFVGIMRDITERKRVENIIQESREKYQSLVNDIGDQFVIFSYNISNNK